MCARYSLHSPLDRLREEFSFTRGPDVLAPRFNIAPTDPIVVIEATNEPVLVQVRWGVDNGLGRGKPLVNARVETASERVTWRRAMAHARCLVPADGFYEWRVEGRARMPFIVTPADGGLWALGGLLVDTPEGLRCVILTTEANDAMRKVHDRMPLIVPKNARATWLDRQTPAQQALARLDIPFPSARTRLRPVSERVNSVRNEGPELLEPPTQTSLFS